jgi:hypothetical protein
MAAERRPRSDDPAEAVARVAVFILSGTDLVDDEIPAAGGHPTVSTEARGRATTR